MIYTFYVLFFSTGFSVVLTILFRYGNVAAFVLGDANSHIPTSRPSACLLIVDQPNVLNRSADDNMERLAVRAEGTIIELNTLLSQVSRFDACK